MPPKTAETLQPNPQARPEIAPEVWRKQGWYTLANTLGVSDLIEQNLLAEKRADGSLMLHAQDVLNEYKRFAPGGDKMTPAQELAVMMHDLVCGNRGLFAGKQQDPLPPPSIPGRIKIEERENGTEFNYGFVDAFVDALHESNKDPETINKGIYALGIAYSANAVEQAAEAFRQKTINTIGEILGEEEKNPLNESRVSHTNEQIDSIVKRNFEVYQSEHEGATEERFKIQILKELRAVLSDGKAPVPDYLREYVPPMADPEDIKKVTDEDIEAIYLKIAEANVNMEHPNPKSPGAAARDAWEAYTYANIAEFLGADELGNRTNSYAKLYRLEKEYPELVEKAKDMEARLADLLEDKKGKKGYRSRINKGLQKILKGETQIKPIYLIFNEEKAKGLRVFEILNPLCIKMAGSIADKSKRKKRGITPPDQIRMRLLLNEGREASNVSNDRLVFEVVELVAMLQEQFGWSLGTVLDPEFNAGETIDPCGIEIRMEGQKPIEGDPPIPLLTLIHKSDGKTERFEPLGRLKPPTETGYSGTHLNFHFIASDGKPVNIEVQVHTPESNRRRLQVAPHFLYAGPDVLFLRNEQVKLREIKEEMKRLTNVAGSERQILQLIDEADFLQNELAGFQELYLDELAGRIEKNKKNTEELGLRTYQKLREAFPQIQHMGSAKKLCPEFVKEQDKRVSESGEKRKKGRREP